MIPRGDFAVDFIQIKIINWEKYQPRKDIKNPSWFAISNRIVEDPKLYSLLDAEWKALLYILSVASQGNSGSVIVYLDHALRVCKIRRKTLFNLINKLDSLGVTSTYAGVTQALLDTTNTTNKTRQNNILSTRPNADGDRRQFDFGILYEGYPRKEGKHKGLALCRSQIKSQEDYDQLKLAIERYSEHIKIKSIESKFIKLFSSFISGGQWRDWLDLQTGTSSGVKKQTTLELLMDLEAADKAKGESNG